MVDLFLLNLNGVDELNETLRVAGDTVESHEIQLSGRYDRSSGFRANIVVFRHWAFYVLTVFGPGWPSS